MAPAAAVPAPVAAPEGFVSSKPACPTNTFTLGAAKRAKYVWKRLRAGGYSPAAAAGVLGNLDQLSAVSPTAVALDGSSAGLLRWPTPQWRFLKAWAAKRGANHWSLRAQTTFLLLHMGSNPGNFRHQAFKGMQRPRAAAQYFHNRFRRTPDKPEVVERTRGIKAEQWLYVLYHTPADASPSHNGTYGLLLSCDPPGATLDACPATPASFRSYFARYTGLPWRGLSANARMMSRCIYTNFPRLTLHGTYNGHMPDWQHAIDFMMPDSCRTTPYRRTNTAADLKLGTRLARYLFMNRSRFNLDYLIWQDRIRNPDDHSDENAWAPVSQWRQDNYNNGNCTNTHFDHVHASLNYSSEAGSLAAPGGSELEGTPPAGLTWR